MNQEAIEDQTQSVATVSRPESLRALLHKKVDRLAELIEEDLTTGEVAELRRLGPSWFNSPTFWRLVVSELDELIYRYPGANRHDAERRWAVILQALAQTRGFYDRSIPLGRALAEAEMAETRMLQLLRASDENLLDHVRLAAHYLVTKAQRANLAELAELVLSDASTNSQWSEEVRKKIARDYYATLKARENTTQQEE